MNFGFNFNSQMDTFNNNMSKHRWFNRKTMVIALSILTVVMIAWNIYFGLMPINIADGGFRTFIIIMLLLWSLPMLVKKPEEKFFKTKWIIPGCLAIVFLIVIGLTSLFTSPLFISEDYRNLIEVSEDGAFDQIESYTSMKIPVVDYELAEKVGEKKLGDTNLGSQFNVGTYSLIKYNDSIYWVAPIEYNGFFQWVNKSSAGSPGYVMVDATNVNAIAEIVYTPIVTTRTAYFNQNLNRHNYFGNMTAMRDGRPHLELDDSGHPYYIDAVITKKFAFVNGTDISGCVITDAKSGQSTYYDISNTPEWVDVIQSPYVIGEQLNYWGKYVHGFFNTMFAKKEMLHPSDGYNYILSNDTLYMNTGLTSIASDESIVGITLTNLRDKSTTLYRIGGATERAAQESAKGKVQEKHYSASFPILLNYDGVPTYFMTLKDNEGLVKMYAYVNVSTYTIVGVGDTISNAQIAYESQIETTSPQETIQVTVQEVANVILDDSFLVKVQNTDGTTQILRFPVSLGDEIAFLNNGDVLNIKVRNNTVISWELA